MSKRSKVDETVKEFYKKEGKNLFKKLDDDYIQTRTVYKQYESYCKANDLETVTIYKFTVDMKKLEPKLRTETKSLSVYYFEN